MNQHDLIKPLINNANISFVPLLYSSISKTGQYSASLLYGVPQGSIPGLLLFTQNMLNIRANNV